jgi:hypothetical protein
MNSIKAIADMGYNSASKAALYYLLNGGNVKAVIKAHDKAMQNNKEQIAKNIMAHNPLFDRLSK